MNKYSKWIEYTTSFSDSYYDMGKPFSWPGFDSKLKSIDKGNLRVKDIRNNHQIGSIFRNAMCPYCQFLLESNYIIQSSQEWKRLDRLLCKKCGWWIFCFSKNKFYLFEDFRNEFYEGAMYNFDFEHTDEPISIIRRRIEQKKIDLRSISPKELEILIGSVFRDFFDVKVKYVGGPGDNGIDLLLARGDRNIAVQVKRREGKGTTEGVSTIRDFLGAILLEDYPKGIVVSTAAKFSKPAVKSSSNPILKRYGIEIDLYQHDMIMDLLEDTKLPEKPWEIVPRVRFHIDSYGKV